MASSDPVGTAWPPPDLIAELDQWDAFLNLTIQRARDHKAQCPNPRWCLGDDVTDAVRSMNVYQLSMCLQTALLRLAGGA